MNNFRFEFEGKEYWYSRACTCGMFVFCKDTFGEWRILANLRGQGCPNQIGKWNAPGGYLDFDETLQQAAARECKEETGVILDLSYVKLFSMHSNPKGLNQNLSFKFYAKLPGYTKDYPITNKFMEKDEVADIKWIKISDISSYDWAFGHAELIMKIYRTMIKPSFKQRILNSIISLLKLEVLH